jgi:hypothetical protein
VVRLNLRIEHPGRRFPSLRLIMLLRERTDLGLAGSKRAVEAALVGDTVPLELPSRAAAAKLARDARELGALAELAAEDSAA